MPQKKIQIAFIASDAARKSTYRKRLKGLLKKIHELSTLCGVEACAVINGPYEAEPVVWPDVEGAGRVLRDFRRMPKMEQQRKMFNQTEYLRERVEKTRHQLTRLQKDNREKDVALALNECLAGARGLHGLTVADLKDLKTLINRRLDEVKFHVVNAAEEQNAPPPQQLPVMDPTILPVGQFYQMAPGGFGDEGGAGDGGYLGDY